MLLEERNVGDGMTKKLSKCRPGKVYKVVDLIGNAETNQFLSNIGLEIGDEIVIISELASNFVITVKDSRFGIDENMAKLIIVEV